MFWCETIKSRCKFCSCEGVWTNFKIVNVIASCSDLLEVYATPEDGSRCLILRMRSGEPIPSSSNIEFKFKPHQHVKFEVYGGEICIVGQAYDGTHRQRNMNRFPSTCPFGDEESWNLSQKILYRDPKNQKDN